MLLFPFPLVFLFPFPFPFLSFFKYLRNVSIEGDLNKPNIEFTADGDLRSAELKIMNLRPSANNKNLVWEEVSASCLSKHALILAHSTPMLTLHSPISTFPLQSPIPARLSTHLPLT